MHTPTPSQAGFKRQVVFRIDAEDWPLLEAAAREYGSIQAAVLAGIRALTSVSAREAEAEEVAGPAKARPTAEKKRQSGKSRLHSRRQRSTLAMRSRRARPPRRSG